MKTGFRSHCAPTYRLLADDQIKELHRATLELLENVGVRVMDQEALQLLWDAGCRIKGDLAQFPNWLVEECLHSTPSRITIYTRDGQEAMHLEGRNVHFGLGTDLPQTYDLHTDALRDSCLQDVINAATIADFCDDIDFLASFALPHDVPTNLMYIDSFKAQVETSPKPIFFTAAAPQDLAVILDMAAVVAGGNEALREQPFLIHYAEPLSPLSHSSGAIQKLFRCAEHGIPVTYTPGMLSGASGPVTLAGAITVANAEALSGIVLHQLKAKGAPIISGFGIATMDMRTTAPIYACPEYRLALSACADLYHYYEIPMWGTAGVSDAHCFDQQASMEAAISLLTAALDGANLVHDVGYLGQGAIGSPATLVMCAELISYVKRLMQGFEIGREWIDMEGIRQVGPGGNFLTADQTLKLFRTHHWQPTLANRDTLRLWKQKGRQTYGDRAKHKALDILKTHMPHPPSDEIVQTLNALRTRAEAALKGKTLEV
ncbi:trimethylamine methyltransferase [candidate division KSB3 bacterium]|uniref:Trimethylamine methyltransferase n=1 Tax=candidate division KSB3 bacterium TaxID=2044937 RepID=A0A9D5JZT5_9BACT|nr:trimethylamine methyltransferase [candidate division KSB3 bacterium]MBD3326812.1 trimethylamine methyltransferase [candidate division KSB3 bacterium]